MGYWGGREVTGIREFWAETIRAKLCLFAVLPNLEDVVRFDPEMADLFESVDVSIEIVVPGYPALFIELIHGTCGARVGSLPAGKLPDARLSFISPAQLNSTFLNARGTIPIFPVQDTCDLEPLRQKLSRLRDRLVAHLWLGQGEQADPMNLSVSAQLKLDVAAFAVPILVDCDPRARLFQSAFRKGSVALKVLPDGPCAGLQLSEHEILPVKGEVTRPTAALFMRGLPVANAFLDRQLDILAAVGRGDIETWGHIPTLDALNMVLDRIPAYL